jgi:DNA repair exonuclease SbcCD ATPase subunit
LKVAEERQLDERVALNNLDDGTINIYLNAPAVSQAVKDALREIIRRKQQIADVVQARQNAEQQIAVVDQEQARIRQNMAQLDRNSELYNRYVQKFAEQEDRVEQLRGEIAQFVEREQALRKALDDYLLSLEVE